MACLQSFPLILARPILAELEMPQAQYLMVAGFVMLGWVLARRQIRMRRRVNQETRVANKAIEQMREHRDPSLPLSDAPVETQRWQVAMFDLQRDLKAELDTRIAIVQTLIRQVDERLEKLASLEATNASAQATGAGSSEQSVRDQK